MTIEALPMFHIPKRHVVRLVARQPKHAGEAAITPRDLLQAADQMRPERLIIGDLHGDEAAEALRMIAEGYDGSMLLMHATTPADALSRLETMILFKHPGVPEAAVRRLIATGLDLIIQQTRLADGQRKITAITEVQGLEQGAYVLHNLFRLEITGTSPEGRILTQWK